MRQLASFQSCLELMHSCLDAWRKGATFDAVSLDTTVDRAADEQDRTYVPPARGLRVIGGGSSSDVIRLLDSDLLNWRFHRSGVFLRTTRAMRVQLKLRCRLRVAGSGKLSFPSIDDSEPQRELLGTFFSSPYTTLAVAVHVASGSNDTHLKSPASAALLPGYSPIFYAYPLTLPLAPHLATLPFVPGWFSHPPSQECRPLNGIGLAGVPPRISVSAAGVTIPLTVEYRGPSRMRAFSLVGPLLVVRGPGSDYGVIRDTTTGIRASKASSNPNVCCWLLAPGIAVSTRCLVDSRVTDLSSPACDRVRYCRSVIPIHPFHRYHNTGCGRSITSLSPDYMFFIHGGPPIHTPSATNALCSRIILPKADPVPMAGLLGVGPRDEQYAHNAAIFDVPVVGHMQP
ncbi:uncharacterized protein B0H18DRAFT_954904 [Fomitopsis serialis]|uniref:uncharacterized protein n=1 Tax=Fomitopsis serialis TaxID=139415 RepID=UPI0020076213|nr:uncharacterized protein B0H18DRAFT_954904 [Neoantrodia serialis]KAH9926016.1 hypothetical protein B0H18DRAFT_954904 [Neoantrodia serialis]